MRDESLNSNSGLRPAASGVVAAVVNEVTAVQRGWRDFRIAQSSCERAITCCQKIGRPAVIAIAWTRAVEAFDESARCRQQIFPR
jgi:hypothetical protein